MLVGPVNFLLVISIQVVHDDASNQEGIGSTVLLLMVRDAYANYVVQTAIDVAPEGNEKRMLIDELKSNEAHLVSFFKTSS
jgi:hypothetical protein